MILSASRRPRKGEPEPGRTLFETLILDGGLATELEADGFDLNHPLWSAKVLIETPEAVRAVHARFLAAGADCVISATYQASFPGLARYGLSDKESERLFRFAVELAAEERNRFWRDPANREGRRRPLVAASVGPYGAFLADGSEYTGDYRADDAALAAFHWRRLDLLARSGADLLAVETIPSAREGRVLRRLLDRLDDPRRRGSRSPAATAAASPTGHPSRRPRRTSPTAAGSAGSASTARRRNTSPRSSRSSGRRPENPPWPTRTATAAGTRSGKSGRRRPRRRTCRSWPSNGAGSGPNSSAAAAGPAPETSGRSAAP